MLCILIHISVPILFFKIISLTFSQQPILWFTIFFFVCDKTTFSHCQFKGHIFQITYFRNLFLAINLFFTYILVVNQFLIYNPCVMPLYFVFALL